MAKRRADQAQLGLTSNGVVIVNVLGLIPADAANALRRALPRGLGKDWFIGAAVSEREASALWLRLDDAAAEGAARLGARKADSPATAARSTRRRSR